MRSDTEPPAFVSGVLGEIRHCATDAPERLRPGGTALVPEMV
nr:hypothetical protein OH837_31000 [Streptomyces canus]